MKVTASHRLQGDGAQAVTFTATTNMGGELSGGAPRFLIVHYTAGGTASGAISWFKTPGSSASAHLVIDHTGAITQCVPFNRVAWHAGRSAWQGTVGLNSHSVGIEIVNWGLLRGEPGAWRSATGRHLPDDRVLRARHKNFDPAITHGWEVFDEAQIEATEQAALAIVRHYGIPESHVLGHDDIAPGRKQDPGPAFDLDRLRGRLFGRAEGGDDLYRVVSGTGLNLRTAPDRNAALIETLADGARLRRIGQSGIWFEVNSLTPAGQEDKTGWVHSRFLAPE